MTHLPDDVLRSHYLVSLVIWYIKFAIMESYKLLVHCICILVCTSWLVNIVSSYHVKCRFPEGSLTGVVEGLEGCEDFTDFLIRCGDEKIKILIYEKCYVGYVSLPIDKIKKSYPSMRRLYWLCNGMCVYQRTNIFVEGCMQGE